MGLTASAFLVRPMEPLYFGSPSSFSAGEQHHGQTLFPPPPSTFQGLVRSHLLHSVTGPPLDLNDWSKSAVMERERIVGGPGALPHGWQIQGPFPARRETIDTGGDQAARVVAVPWVPAPRFLLRHKSAPLHARPVYSSHPGLNDLTAGREAGNEPLLMGRPENGALAPLPGWIGPDNLWYALAGEGKAPWHDEQYGDPLPPFVFREARPGVAIDPRRHTSLYGMLYTLSSLRFHHDAGFAGWFSGRLDERVSRRVFSGGIAGAGRKRRLVVFEDIPDVCDAWRRIRAGDHLPREVEEKQLFWLLALTPASVQRTSSPLLRVSLSGGVRPVIRAALTGPPLTLGGYQMATGRSRPNRPYVPAGSAWLFHLEGGAPETRARALGRLHDKHVLGPAHEAGFGFGHTLVGIGPTEEGELP